MERAGLAPPVLCGCDAGRREWHDATRDRVALPPLHDSTARCALSLPGGSATRGALLEMSRRGRGDCPPGVPGDVQDDERDREADDRVGDGDAERDDGGADDDAEADEAVNAG